jgi:hypothetical protein
MSVFLLGCLAFLQCILRGVENITIQVVYPFLLILLFINVVGMDADSVCWFCDQTVCFAFLPTIYLHDTT